MHTFCLLTLLILVFSENVRAEKVLVVPQKDILWEDYKEKCHKQNFLCTTEYFFNETQKENSILWNQFVNQLDLDNPLFKKNYLGLIKKMISEETLQWRDLEMLIALHQQILTEEPENKNYLQLKNQLDQMKMILQESRLEWPVEKLFVVAGKPISSKDIEKLQKNLLNVSVTEIDFIKWPQKKKLFDVFKPSEPAIDLVQNCHTDVISALATTYEIVKPKSCPSSSFAIHSSVKNTGHWIQENKNPLLLSLAAVIVYGLSQNYSVSFE